MKCYTQINYGKNINNLKKALDLYPRKLLYYYVMRNEKMKDLEMINNQPTFEECSEWTYWKNKKTGTIVTLGLFREYNPRKEHLDVSTINTRYELTYYYSYEELCEKFDYLGGHEEWNEESYINVLSNKNLYWKYRQALKGIPRCNRVIKNGCDSNVVKENLEKYTNWKSEFERNFEGVTV